MRLPVGVTLPTVGVRPYVNPAACTCAYRSRQANPWSDVQEAT
ncbi:MAG TPA: hypothetical protein VEC96_03955 [Anaerolineae bacterium]|nr:hypothetical protein [Anaerolineae bacterium]